MKIILAVLALAVAASAPALAATDQQNKMKQCNADAKGMKGDERKEFMKNCLSASSDKEFGKPMTAQQSKMKSCNADAAAKKLKGDERKTFMKSCLSG